MWDIIGLYDMVLALGFFIAFFVWLPIYAVISIVRWMCKDQKEHESWNQNS